MHKTCITLMQLFLMFQVGIFQMLVFYYDTNIQNQIHGKDNGSANNLNRVIGKIQVVNIIELCVYFI